MLDCDPDLMVSDRVRRYKRRQPARAPDRWNEHVLLAMTRQSEDSFARRLLDEVGATQPLRARIEAAIGQD